MGYINAADPSVNINYQYPMTSVVNSVVTQFQKNSAIPNNHFFLKSISNMKTSLIYAFGLCAVYQKLSDLTEDRPFDFVIAGGGTAGAVLASRLSEMKDLRVLVIEAGPSNEGVLDSLIPALSGNLLNSPYDWNFTTTPQKFGNNRRVPYGRGHILGGSSSINAMVYTRGSVDDYDRWARVTGDPGWSWNSIFPYFKKHEHFVQPRDQRNITGEYNPAVHGFDGMALISSANLLLKPFDEQIIAAADELGGVFQFNLDMNSGNPLGTGRIQGTNGGGERSSSASAYLTQEVLGRKNLYVLLNTRITRIQQSGNQELYRPEFDSVEVVGDDNKLHLLQATKEVILSAGSIGSPQILLQSGIGDTQELQSVGINPLVNLPDVGKNLTDHPRIIMDYAANDIGQNVLATPLLMADALIQWESSRTGPLTDLVNNNLIWGRVPENSSFDDPSAGPTSPHWELLPAPNLGNAPAPHLAVGISIVSPASRGTLSINSSNPLDPPLIDPAFFTSPVDLAIARDAIRNMRTFFSAKAWNGTIIPGSLPSAYSESDEDLNAVISAIFDTSFHPASTAMMSPKEANYGVVDPDLRVKGVRGLRVVDASVMPFIPSCHIQTAVYVIAERAADLIKQNWF